MLSITTTSWGYSCPAYQYLEINHTQNLYSNSAIWVTKLQDRQYGSFKAKSKNDFIQYRTNLSNSNQRIIKLTPIPAYKENTTYLIRNKHLEQQYPSEYLSLKILSKTSVVEPKLITPPILSSYEYNNGNDQTPPSGQIQFKFIANIDSRNYLVRLRVSHSKDFINTSEFILKPDKDEEKMPNQNHKFPAIIHSSFDICNYGIQFKKNDQFWIKIDFITHDGKILIDQLPPSKINIQKLPDQDQTVKNLAFWQKILIKVKEFINLFFSIL